MPRRSASKTTEDPNVEKRVTRRSLRGAAEKETPKKEQPARASASPSPRGRGRGRGRGTPRSGGREEEKEPEDVEEGQSSPATSPSKGRGRGRGRGRSTKRDVEEGDGEDEGSPNVEVQPSRRGRGARNASKKETSTPKRRGRRSQVAAEEDQEEPTEEDEELEMKKPETETKEDNKDEEKMEESTEEPSGEARKRKIEIDDQQGEMSQAEKKCKIDESEVKQESKPQVQSKNEDMETDDHSKEPSEKVETIKGTSDGNEASKKPAVCSPNKEKKETIEDKTVVEEPQPEIKSDMQSSPQKEHKTETKEEAPLSEKQIHKTDSTVSEVNIESKKAADTTSNAKEKQDEPLKDYVVINMEDVPPTDSKEVTESLPQEKISQPQEQKESEKAVSETPAPEETMHKFSPEKPAVSNQAPTPASLPQVPEAIPTPAIIPNPEQKLQQPMASPVTEPKPQASADEKVKDLTSAPQQPQQETHTQNTPAPQAPAYTGTDTASGDQRITNSTMPEINSSIRNGTMNNSTESNADILFNRKVARNPYLPVPVARERSYSLVSYNILADCHALKSKELYNWLTPEKLSIRARQNRLLQELKYLDADIMCLQEVSPDFFQNVLMPTFKGLGYDGVLKKRQSIDCDEGSATFYRTSRFTMISHRGLGLSDLAIRELESCGLDGDKVASVVEGIRVPTVVLVTQLRCNATGQKITVGNVHVGWDHLKRPDLQCIQAACAVKEVVAMGDGPENAHVLCGDFNSTPDSPVFQLMKDGYLNDSSVATLQALKNIPLPDGQHQALVNLWWKGFQHTSPSMRSSYNLVTGTDPVTTRYVDIGQCRKADYIWCGGSNLDVSSVLAAPPDHFIANGIPNDVFPSDHLSLKAELFFK